MGKTVRHDIQHDVKFNVLTITTEIKFTTQEAIKRLNDNLKVQWISVVECVNNGCNKLWRFIKDGSQGRWDVAVSSMEKFTTLAWITRHQH